MRARLSHKWITGHGIEIGGLHFPTPVLPGVVVDYVDRSLEDVARNHGDVMPSNYKVIVDDAEQLINFDDNSQDFLIANHVIEHCHDPLGTLRLWIRTVRPGGIVYCAIPEKTKTFDKDRAITPLSHLVQDYFEASPEQDEPHYRDWFSVIDHLQGEELENKIKWATENKINIHFHVWDYAAMQEIMASHYITQLAEVVDVGDNGAEIIWVLRRK